MANRIADPAQYTTKTTLGGAELLHSNDANQDRLFTVDTLSTYAGNKAIPPGYIDGLVLTWVSGTALTITSGSSYIPSLARVLRAPSDIAKTGLSLSASTWYHVYLYLNGSTPDVEIATTVPSSPYNGKARTKNGDPSRRYLGSIRTSGSGVILKFVHYMASSQILYNAGPSNAVLTNGAATTSTPINCSSFAPVTATAVVGRFVNAGVSSSPLSVSDGDQDPTVSSFFAIAGGVSLSLVTIVPLNSSQILNYATGASGSAYAQVCGYYFDR